MGFYSGVVLVRQTIQAALISEYEGAVLGGVAGIAIKDKLCLYKVAATPQT